MKAEDKKWLRQQVSDQWERLGHVELDVTDAESIKAELAKTYGYEREKAEYEYEQFMNSLIGREGRAEHLQKLLGDEQNRGPLSERLD